LLQPVSQQAPLSLRDISRESKGSRKRDALGWSSAAELGWAPGMEGAHGRVQCRRRREEQLSRSSCSAKPSRAEGTACRH